MGLLDRLAEAFHREAQRETRQHRDLSHYSQVFLDVSEWGDPVHITNERGDVVAYIFSRRT